MTIAYPEHEISDVEVPLQYQGKPLGVPKSNHFQFSPHPIATNTQIRHHPLSRSCTRTDRNYNLHEYFMAVIKNLILVSILLCLLVSECEVFVLPERSEYRHSCLVIFPIFTTSAHVRVVNPELHNSCALRKRIALVATVWGRTIYNITSSKFIWSQ